MVILDIGEYDSVYLVIDFRSITLTKKLRIPINYLSYHHQPNPLHYHSLVQSSLTHTTTTKMLSRFIIVIIILLGTVDALIDARFPHGCDCVGPTKTIDPARQFNLVFAIGFTIAAYFFGFVYVVFLFR